MYQRRGEAKLDYWRCQQSSATLEPLQFVAAPYVFKQSVLLIRFLVVLLMFIWRTARLQLQPGTIFQEKRSIEYKCVIFLGDKL